MIEKKATNLEGGEREHGDPNVPVGAEPDAMGDLAELEADPPASHADQVSPEEDKLVKAQPSSPCRPGNLHVSSKNGSQRHHDSPAYSAQYTRAPVNPFAQPTSSVLRSTKSETNYNSCK